MGPRRQARTIALQALYEIDTAHHSPEASLSHLLEEEGVVTEVATFARELVGGVLAHREEIDPLIGRLAPAYPLAMLSPIDRNILRLAIYELLFNSGVPLKAAINEAVELAKAFGNDNSSRFINGVLGSVSTLALEKHQKSKAKEVI